MEKNKSITVSLDLEDWSWDFKFRHGFLFNEPRHEVALINALEKFAALTQTHSDEEKKALIYVTGNLIENYPSVIRRAVELGFAIGCHCYDHVNFRARNIADARNDLQRFLTVAQQYDIDIVPYFRAPMFSINKYDVEHLNLIFEFFSVESGIISDSSVLNSSHEPVTRIKIFNSHINLGGSFISWLPGWAVSWISVILNKHDNIHIYLHPYELVEEPVFAISYAELRQRFCFHRACYYYVRQFQWNNYNGRKIFNKISLLSSDRIFNIGLRVNSK